MQQRFHSYPHLCSELVWIAIRQKGGDLQLGNGNLEAISQDRLLILAEDPVRRGTEITICARTYVLKGRVETCRIDEPLGCYIEVQLAPESRWTEEWFRPEHMLTVAMPVRAVGAPKRLPLENTSVAENLIPGRFIV